ncbi:hypothetical protein ACP3W1_24060, partial [Salmonella enterica]|uniref:hypothetical protein n=1 Tax=Salmonella enterica TaxID=28901 RepID=UPI003CF5041C
MGSLKHGAAALAWLLCAAGAHAADGTRGPQRNLMIEVRQGDGAELGVSGASVQPGVTVRSDGRITGAVSGGIEART